MPLGITACLLSHPSDTFDDIRQPVLVEIIVQGSTADGNKCQTHPTTYPSECCGVLSAALARPLAKVLVTLEDSEGISGGRGDLGLVERSSLIY